MSDLWPFVVITLVGFLPTEVWRVLAVVLARDLKTDSEILIWVRMVATALLAAVVAKIVVAPPGLLVATPLWGRIASLVAAGAVLLLARRNVPLAVLAGEAVLIGSYLVR